MVEVTSEAPATLRKDAERNRQKLLAAGRELFAERGFGVTLNDIAHHAGVGVGTAYRRFANKEALMDALFEEQVEEVDRLARECLAEPDAWTGLVRYLEISLQLQSRDRGLTQLLSGRRVRPEQHDWSRDRLAPLVNAMVERAKEQGAVRADVSGTDLVFLQVALIAVIDLTRELAPDTVRRELGIILDGLRARTDRPSPLPTEPLSLELTHRIMGQRTHGPS